MAFPSLAAVAVTSRGTPETSSPVSLPAGVSSGELLLAMVETIFTSDIVWPAGWTELLQEDVGGGRFSIAYRRADGNEGPTVTVTHASALLAGLAYRITNAQDPAVQPPEISAGVAGSDANPNPDSFSPTGGAKDYLWLALEWHLGPNEDVSAYPLNYPLLPTQASAAPLAGGRVSAAGRQLAAAAENPGAFTLTQTADWRAHTIAIHPSGALTAPAAVLQLDAPAATIRFPYQLALATPATLELSAPAAQLVATPRIPEGQSALAAATIHAPVVLVKLTTFSDHGAGSVQAEYFWTAGQNVLYRYQGGPDRSFEDAILRVGTITRKIEHLPNATLMDLRQTGLELVVANEALPAGGTRWSELRTRNLLYARVELSVLLINPARRRPSSPMFDSTLEWDLRDLVGTDHVVWFRGECLHVGPITPTEIPLSFEATEPVLDWPRATAAADCDPRHLGARYPIAIGRAKGLPVVNRKVGWVTTLAAEIPNESATGPFLVTDATGLPDAGSFTLQIGAERVTATKVGLKTISISARAAAGTLGIAHRPSEQLIEVLAESLFVVSGVAAKALDALYVVSPLTGEKVEIRTGFSVALADPTVDTGRTLAVVRFTAQQFGAMIDAMAAVSQQPTLSGGGSADGIPFQAFDAVTPSPYTAEVRAIAQASPNRISVIPSAAIDSYGRVRWTSTAGMPNPNEQVTRFRLRFSLQGFGGDGSPGNQRVTLWCRLESIYGRTFDQLLYSFEQEAAEFGISVETQWFNPGAGGPFAESALTAGQLHFWITDDLGQGQGAWVFPPMIAEVLIDSCEIEVELTPATLSDIAIAAVSLGWGLEFMADVEGAMDASAALVESGPDVIEWLISVFAGLGPGAIERTSFTAAEANLGTHKLAGDLRVLGDTFALVLQGLAFHSRANLAVREAVLGSRYRLLCAAASNAFGTPLRTLTELREQIETRREASEQVTRFLGHYQFESSQLEGRPGPEQARGLVRIDKDANDATAKVATAALTAAEAKYGKRIGEPLSFPLIGDLATAIDVLGYYAFESIADRGRFAVTVPYAEGYDLELGDVVSLIPQGYAGTLKVRVVQLTLHPGEPHVGLVLEEVT